MLGTTVCLIRARHARALSGLSGCAEPLADVRDGRLRDGRRRRRRGGGGQGTCGWRRALTAADLHVVVCVQTAVRVADPALACNVTREARSVHLTPLCMVQSIKSRGLYQSSHAPQGDDIVALEHSGNSSQACKKACWHVRKHTSLRSPHPSRRRSVRRQHTTPSTDNRRQFHPRYPCLQTRCNHTRR